MQSRTKLTLAMDTSGSPLLLAVEKDGKVLPRAKRRQAGKTTVPGVKRRAGQSGRGAGRYRPDFIIRGPGRFTGIRISLTFASMMKYLNHTEVRGTTVFDVIRFQAASSRKFGSWQKRHPQGALGIVLHAFREEYFLQIFDGENAGPAWLSREELLARLAAYKQPLFWPEAIKTARRWRVWWVRLIRWRTQRTARSGPPRCWKWPIIRRGSKTRWSRCI